MNRTIVRDIFAGRVYPWEILPVLGEFIKTLGRTLPKGLYDRTAEDVWVAGSAEVAASAYICGPCIIDAGAQVRHSALIRGNTVIGKNAVVGNSSEIKNSVLFDGVKAPHFNYIGDSVIGYLAHFGAGAVASNVRNDKSEIRIRYGNSAVETGLAKFGAAVGDCAEIGCNAVLFPGTVIGRNTDVYPLSGVRGYVAADSIFKDKNNIVTKE